ncbi:hypothetical protein D3C84_1246380 [compost metagenome]
MKLVEPNIASLPAELAQARCELLDWDALAEVDSSTLIAVLVAHKPFKGSAILRERACLDFCGALN